MQELNKPVDPLVAAMVEELDSGLQEAFEERAGIIEFEAQLPRAHAECLALLDVIRRHPSAITGVTLLQIELGDATQWLVTTDVALARSHLGEMDGIERGVPNLSEVIHTQYGGVALLTTLR